MRFKLINIITTSNELREALRELDSARLVVSAAAGLLSQIDQMKSQDEVETIKSGDIDNVYSYARYLDGLTPKIRYRVPGLELLFYETDTQERRIHLFYDLMSYYSFFSNFDNLLAYAIPFNLVYDDKLGNDDKKVYAKARVAAMRDFISRNNLPESCLYNVNYTRRGYIILERMSELYDILESRKKDHPQVYVFNTINRALGIGRDFVDEVEYLASIYSVDLESIRTKVEKLQNKMGAEEKEHLETKTYKFMPRTHRIAAVKELIRKSGLCRSVDDTRISAFVEAVTGGNIEARPQDTVSYKTPTKEAQKNATEWLKKIGIE